MESKLTIDYLRHNDLICYEFIRGSHLHGLNTAKSDIDVGGVFFAPAEMVLGLGARYVPQVSDERNDTTYYEFGRWMELLGKSNPNAMEGLFAPRNFIVGTPHPIIERILLERNKFLSKEGVNYR